MKSSARLLKTTNYSLFSLTDFNRDVSKTKKLEASMKKHGFIEAYPLHVVKESGKLKIKGGHHRFTVAANLGLPIPYVICSDTSSIHELEDATIKWSMEDYLVSFVRLGDPDYIAVKKFNERTNIPLAMCVSMLAGETASSNNHRARFKNGEFSISKNTKNAEDVADIVGELKKCGVTWGASALCVGTLSRIVSAGHADIVRLKARIKANAGSIQKKANHDQFMEMWEDIYNKNSKSKRVPLAFLTDETMKERSLFALKKP
jgi:hypothetical protein